MIDIEKILNEIKTLPAYESQISLQTVEGEQNPSYGTGKVKNLEHSESCFKIALFPQLTYLNSVIESLGMYRTRLMNMSPKTCYTYHRDLTKRIHIPLITNENCFMVIEDKCFWYPADGNYYLVDTTKPHTFVNASREYRLHVVGCVDENN